MICGIMRNAENIFQSSTGNQTSVDIFSGLMGTSALRLEMPVQTLLETTLLHKVKPISHGNPKGIASITDYFNV